jgi:serine/threonine protein kinase
MENNNKQKQAKALLAKQQKGEGEFTENPAAKLSSADQKALTQIESSFQSEHTEQGFIDAKQDADRALAENKIILKHRFVLKETLGSGGMGTVYKAQDLRKVEARDNNPFVAAKILNSDFRNHPDAFISLQREASRSHLLSHPHIVTVHDFDRDGDTIFMTMELLDGEDLEALLNSHQGSGLAKEKALEILKDFCMALDFAHKKGIIHSDLKPGNIFVTKDEGTKVLDFGIARLALESKNQDHFDAGRIGAITPAYASLEMINRQPPDARDDVFAAAIIAYELLTGVHPYSKQSAATAVAMHISPTRPPDLSKRQWQALSNALQLKRADRTKTIKEFIDGMTLTPKISIYRTISIGLLSVISWFIYNLFFAPNELSRVIDETLIKATECFEANNYNCTIESANAILEIAPEHQLAIGLRQQAQINQLMGNIDNCLINTISINCAIQQFDLLKNIISDPGVLDKVDQRIQQRKLSLEVQSLLTIATDCFSVSDYKCAIQNTSAILKIQLNHQQAKFLLQQSEQAFQQQKIAFKQQDEDFSKLMSKARKCYKQNNFACSSQNAKRALALKPDEADADVLYQDSIYAQKQQLENLKKADRVLRDGQKCLAKLDYSCAIAKSESALEFVPNYKKALQLKRDATESLNKVKKNIQIE